MEDQSAVVILIMTTECIAHEFDISNTTDVDEDSPKAVIVANANLARTLYIVNMLGLKLRSDFVILVLIFRLYV